MFYKKPETKIKHDKLRKDHIDLIQRCESEYAKTGDKEIGAKIERLYTQLEIYDEEFIYEKNLWNINTN